MTHDCMDGNPYAQHYVTRNTCTLTVTYTPTNERESDMYPDSPTKECPDCKYYATNDCSLCQGDGVVWYTVTPTEYEGDE